MAQSVIGKRAQMAVAAVLSGAIALGGMAPMALAEQTGDIVVPEVDLDQVAMEVQSTSDGELTKGWTRLAGIEDSKNNRHADRYGTMEKIIEEMFVQGGIQHQLNYVVIASGADFPDALTASSLAGLRGQCPVLITKPNKLSDEAKTQLERLKPDSKPMTAYIMGGTKSVSDTVVKEIEDLGINTTRISGTDRIGTSIEVFKNVAMIKPSIDTVILATESTFADSLSVGPLSYNAAIPIILVQKDGTLSKEALSAITSNHAVKNILIVGGKNSVSDKVISEQLGTTDYHFDRISGDDRYGTSKAIAEYLIDGCGFSWNGVCVATGINYPDALVGAAFAGRNGTVLLLADKTTDVTVEFAEKKQNREQIRYGSAYVLGGEQSVKKALKDYLDENIPVVMPTFGPEAEPDPSE